MLLSFLVIFALFVVWNCGKKLGTEVHPELFPLVLYLSTLHPYLTQCLTLKQVVFLSPFYIGGNRGKEKLRMVTQ